MRVSNYIYFILIICLMTGISSCKADKSGLGQLGKQERALVLRNGTQIFDKKRWSKAGPETRGTMTANLLQSGNFVDAKNVDVFELLGERTCYIDYEDQPCYELILDGKWYFLVLSVNHSNYPGRITGIDLYPRD